MHSISYKFCTELSNVSIASSACLLGDKVRYDAKRKSNILCLEIIPRYLQIIKFCPEVAIGLSVPRPPVQLISTDKGIQAVGVEDPDLNISNKLNRYADCFLDKQDALSGIIFKSRSPSCGLNSTPLHDENSKAINLTSGLVASALRTQQPAIPMIEDDQLETDWPWFVFCCYLFADAEQYKGEMKYFFQTHLKQLGLAQTEWDSKKGLAELFQLIRHNIDCQNFFDTTK